MAELDADLSFGEFHAVSFEQWRAAAEKALGASLDSVAAGLAGGRVAPLLADDDRPQGSRALWEQAGWRVGQVIAGAEAEQIAACLLEGRGELDVGWVELEGSLRAGCRTTHGLEGARVAGPAELGPIVSAARDCGVDVVLQADAAAPRLLAAWCTLDPLARGLSGMLADPLGTLAQLGARGSSLRDAYASLADTTRAAIAVARNVPEANVSRGDSPRSDATFANRTSTFPGARTGAGPARAPAPIATILADGVPYHDAGASPAVALGAAIAAGLSHLRGLAEHGLSHADAAPHLVLRLSLHTDLFTTVATLRAARLVWGACLRQLGAPGEPRIWARTSWRHGSRLDLPVNLLRHTLQAFAGSIGGVEHLYVQPHTEACGQGDADARRWARNIQHLLRGESRLHIVADPSAGSPYLEHLTRDIAARAWDVARALSSPDPETALLAALQPGSTALRAHALAEGPMVGVDLHPDPAPPSPRVAAPAAGPACDDPPVVSAPPLARERIAARYEILRERASAWAAARPSFAASVAIAPDAPRAGKDAARRLAALLGWPIVDAPDPAATAPPAGAGARPPALHVHAPSDAPAVLRLAHRPAAPPLDLGAISSAGAQGLAELLDRMEARG